MFHIFFYLTIQIACWIGFSSIQMIRKKSVLLSIFTRKISQNVRTNRLHYKLYTHTHSIGEQQSKYKCIQFYRLSHITHTVYRTFFVCQMKINEMKRKLIRWLSTNKYNNNKIIKIDSTSSSSSDSIQTNYAYMYAVQQPER